ERGACAVSIDGKAQRGRLKFEQEEAYPIHAVSLVEHQTGIVLTQGHVEQTSNETKNVLADTKTKKRLADNETKNTLADTKPKRKQQSKRKKDKEKKEQEE